MCEYHLKGSCFHPEKVTKGKVAENCNVHSCNQCTSKSWQTTMINKEIDYHQMLLDLASNKKFNQTSISPVENQQENRFKNPFNKFISKSFDKEGWTHSPKLSESETGKLKF